MDRRNFFTRMAGLAATSAGAALITGGTGGIALADNARPVGMGRKNIPNVPVMSQEGKTYKFFDDLVKGKTVLINFFYAECTGICPRMTSNLLKIQKGLGDCVGRDTFIYSISLKPEQDTPAKLAHYAGMHGIKPGSGWLFLRAQHKNMELLRERLGFKDSEPAVDADVNQHTGILRIGNDVYDRWAAYPLLGKAETIVEVVRQMDPNAPRHSLY
ncbi:MAG TPA: SCO family protein [Candidatus Acidoferrales bacterium]|jgi:protein SCO1/2|nr:SCO family protein [Candidatus Acidoferrales bacterium]